MRLTARRTRQRAAQPLSSLNSCFKRFENDSRTARNENGRSLPRPPLMLAGREQAEPRKASGGGAAFAITDKDANLSPFFC